MTLQSATLYAAIIAAIASVAGAMITILQRRASEDRAAYRRTFEPFLHELGDAIYQLVATCNILAKKDPGQGWDNWFGRAENHRDRLLEVRPKVRYPLWGLDKGIRTLTRLPGWVSHKRGNPEQLNQLLDGADKLRSAIDEVVLHSFQKGRPPVWLERRRVNCRANRLYQVFGDRETNDE